MTKKLITILLFSTLLSACTKYIDDYIIIKPPFMFTTEVFENVADLKDVKFAVKGRNRFDFGRKIYRICLKNIIVDKGSITFFVKNGSITFFPNQRVFVNIPTENLILEYQTTEKNIFVNLPNWGWTINGYNRYDVSIYPPPYNIGEYNKNDLKPPVHTSALELLYKLENGYFLVRIPIEKSKDYQGAPIRLVIDPDFIWYDF